jgi:hypothetical protein
MIARFTCSRAESESPPQTSAVRSPTHENLARAQPDHRLPKLLQHRHRQLDQQTFQSISARRHQRKARGGCLRWRRANDPHRHHAAPLRRTSPQVQRRCAYAMVVYPEELCIPQKRRISNQDFSFRWLPLVFASGLAFSCYRAAPGRSVLPRGRIVPRPLMARSVDRKAQATRSNTTTLV